MKIAVVHNLPPGGAWRRMQNQVQALDVGFTEVCLETATPFSPSPRVVAVNRHAERLPAPMRPPARYADLVALERAWGRANDVIASLNPDAVFLNPCRFLQTPPIRAPWSNRTLYFCDEPRRVDYEPDAASNRRQATRALYAALYARERRIDSSAAKSVRSIATNSHFTARGIQQAYGRSAAVLRLGVAQSLSDPTDDGPRGDFILSVGTLIPSKGHDLVIRSAAITTNRPEVRIVSPRPSPDYQASLERLAQSLGVHVTVQVGVSDAVLGRLYRGARATLYLARREPLGLVSLEAQAQGCPVIVADEGGLPETIEPGLSGWACAREPTAVAALLDRLSDSQLATRLANGARANAATWTWQASASQLARLLEDVQAPPAGITT